MKKTLVALAVMAVSSTASAGIELYNEGGVSVDFGGDLELRYQQDKAEGSDFQQKFDDSDINFDVRYVVSEGVQVGATWGINDLEAPDVTGGADTFVALYTDTTTVKIGRLCTQLDDAGIGSDYAFGLDTFFSGSDSVYCDDELVRVDYDQGAVYGGIALAQDKNGSNLLEDDSVFVDLKAGYRAGDFDFTGFYGAGEMEEGANTWDESTWSLQARYNGVENLGLAVAYYNTDKETVSYDTIGLAVTYQVTEVVALAAGYSNSASDATGEDDFGAWYVNAGYTVAPGSTVYAEIGGDNGEQANVDTGVVEDTQLGMVVGVKVAF